MTLFSDPLCPYCHRVRMVLAEKGIAVDVVDVDANNLPGRGHGASIPTARCRPWWTGICGFTSRASSWSTWTSASPTRPLLPVDPVSRANARLFMYRVERDWYGLMGRIFLGSEAEAAQARKELRDSLIATAPVFAAHPFFMSDEFSLVDCCVAPLLWRLPAMGIQIPGPGQGGAHLHDADLCLGVFPRQPHRGRAGAGRGPLSQPGPNPTP